jgi:ribosomal protein S18 acetylase RimI-like enzyme
VSEPRNQGVRIRPATAADLPALGRLGALLVRLHHELDPARFIAATPETERLYGAFLGRQATAPEAIVLVAEEGEAVLGYAFAAVEGTDYMALRGPAGVLHDLVVDPAQRRRGVGRLLLEAAVAALGERGVPRVILSTAARNDAAQQLFARAGFRTTMIEMAREVEGAR